MDIRAILNSDGIEIRCAVTEMLHDRGTLVLIIPFGLRVEIAKPFFDHFADHFNVVCWESRLILAPEDRHVELNELTIEHHVRDLFFVLDFLSITSCNLIGYCSGAGVALKAVTQQPVRFDRLALVNGDYTLTGNKQYMTQHGSDIDSILPICATDVKTAGYILAKLDLSGSASGEDLPEGIFLPFSNPVYFHRYGINYHSYKHADFVELANKVETASLVVAGGIDKQTNVESSRFIHENLKDSLFHIQQDADHYDVLRAGSGVLSFLERYFLTNFSQEELCYAL
jgi:pimeloyl-ACP methyl ester carboxylesterase